MTPVLNLCYTLFMDLTQAHWSAWLDALRRQKLDGLAVWFLEAAAPLHILTAQLLYIAQPLVPSQTAEHLNTIAHLLEQSDETQTFAAYLKGQQQ
ncbi:MAG: hypothetical protein DDG60_05430 [Anaerolineae bacterium]|nr:MAG: hypothetical protein DDG60_05430 [Anaerolineae bacterium]